MIDDSVVRVVVIDDHEMFLQSLVRSLGDDPQIVVVGTALNAMEGIEVTRRERPDVIIIDYHLPDLDAPAAIGALLALRPDAKIITFSGAELPGAYYASLQAGSSAWVLKTRPFRELRDTILDVAAGRRVESEEMKSLPTLDQLVLHFQPIVELASRRIVGFEALVRWQHPERGLLYPDAFLNLAETTGYISEIDRWVRAAAIRQLAEWQQRYSTDEHLWMSVNVSASDLKNPNLFASIHDLVVSSKIDSRDLIFEITETVLLDDTDEVTVFLRRLKELGVGLALDDFGTAFSSLSYVRRFPFDHLKLDISFTAELPHSERSMKLVEEICRIAQSMEMKGIAEGIERTDQLDALMETGWTIGQGFLFSKSLPASECELLLSGQTTIGRSLTTPSRRHSLVRSLRSHLHVTATGSDLLLNE